MGRSRSTKKYVDAICDAAAWFELTRWRMIIEVYRFSFVSVSVSRMWASGNLLLSFTVPGANEVSPSQKPRSRGLFQSLLCCLCGRETDAPPVKNNAPLPVEENGALSKVSKSYCSSPPSAPPLCFLSPPSPSSFEQHVVRLIDSCVMHETHVFSAQSYSCLLVFPWAERQCTSASPKHSVFWHLSRWIRVSRRAEMV